MVVLRDLQLVYVFNYVSILMCSQRPKSWKLIPLPPESVTSFDMPWYSCLWMCFSKFPMGLLVGGRDESLISEGIWRFKIQNKLCDRVLLFGRSNTFLLGANYRLNKLMLMFRERGFIFESIFVFRAYLGRAKERLNERKTRAKIFDPASQDTGEIRTPGLFRFLGLYRP